MMFVDLDHFKSINDSLGHAIGDKLLQSVSARLQACVRASDTVSRQGGDEFVVLLPCVADWLEGKMMAERLLQSLRAPHTIGSHTLYITGSVGISVYPRDGEDAETLLQHSDMAMYGAKEQGRNNYQFFRPEMNLRAVARQTLESGLRRALEEKEFVLHYQPKVNLSTGLITGAEALIRWRVPAGELLAPGQFIKAAEDTGLILPIDLWVLREACRQTRVWLDAGWHDASMAVNLSAMSFRDPAFIQNVRSILRETELDGSHLQLELTEGIVMKNVDSTAWVLRELKKMGVKLAIDDFGTGYSSLSYLRYFPIDVLKIDRSFVKHIMASPKDALLVTAIIAMGRSLDYLVVAEGIETEEQRHFLQAAHCEEGQGYSFSRALPSGEFVALLGAGFHRQDLVAA